MNNDAQGWINVYKPVGISSFKALNKIKKNFRINKIGHGGTLDPNAEGILPIAIGKATKLIQFINTYQKEYDFEVKWGEQTSTDDKEGEIIGTSKNIPHFNDIKKKLIEFHGEIMQKPPKASAVKIQGIRAYKLLRKEKFFYTTEKKVFLYSSKVFKSKNPLITRLIINCSKGFYVRSLARDLAEKLNTKGHIFSLKRTKVGKFDLKNVNLLDDLLKIRQELTEFKGFHTSISMLDDILAYEIDEADEIKKISSGKSINLDEKILSKTSSNLLSKKIIFLTNNGKVLSFGNLIGNLFKPQKVLI